ncbi:MAG TPA: hypothetical protein VNY05_20935 [Candidatus Acidoferrales bacterium]|nr:hypothetical protein [Candidatus Acidoferrales bacterium]
MTGAAQPVSLLFAEVLLFWHATNYLLSADPIRNGDRNSFSRKTLKRLAWFFLRATGAAVLTAAVAGWRSGTLLAGAMLIGCVFLPAARWLWVPSRYVAELELAVNAGFAALAQFLITHFDMQVRWGLFRLPASEAIISAYTVAAALLIFVVRGGTFIVRGVLDRAGTMPPPELVQPTSLIGHTALDLQRALPVDTIELNHGRLIGNIERLILVLLVANGQYTALAFFFAAKGLIRSKDVERRAWADYLILGSLTSFLVAVVAGLLIQAAFRSGTP